MDNKKKLNKQIILTTKDIIQECNCLSEIEEEKEYTNNELNKIKKFSQELIQLKMGSLFTLVAENSTWELIHIKELNQYKLICKTPYITNTLNNLKKKLGIIHNISISIRIYKILSIDLISIKREPPIIYLQEITELKHIVNYFKISTIDMNKSINEHIKNLRKEANQLNRIRNKYNDYQRMERNGS